MERLMAGRAGRFKTSRKKGHHTQTHCMPGKVLVHVLSRSGKNREDEPGAHINPGLPKGQVDAGNGNGLQVVLQTGLASVAVVGKIPRALCVHKPPHMHNTLQ